MTRRFQAMVIDSPSLETATDPGVNPRGASAGRKRRNNGPASPPTAVRLIRSLLSVLSTSRLFLACCST